MGRHLVAMGIVGGLWLGAPELGSPVASKESSVPAAAPVAVQAVSIPAPAIRDEAAMVLLGSALIGLAAAVRRAA